jgi:hypothetical protein
MYIAITLGAKVIMHFPAEDAHGFYSKLQKDEAGGETVPLVPTIDAKQAQATVESDRERIFQEITESIGMEESNRQLQKYLEGAMKAAAMEVLLQRGGLESVGAGGSKATLGVLRAELEQMKQMLAKGQDQSTREVADTMGSLAKGQKETEVQVLAKLEKTQQEMTALAAVQEETKQDTQEIKQRLSALEEKIDTVLELLRPSGGVSSPVPLAPTRMGYAGGGGFRRQASRQLRKLF